jgi:hypothetical protein
VRNSRIDRSDRYGAYHYIALLLAAEQRLGLPTNNRELGFEHIPDNAVVNFRVTVDKNVAKSNNPPVLANPRGRIRIDTGQLRQGFTNNLQLPFHCRAQQGIVTIIREALTCDDFIAKWAARAMS